MIFDLVVIVILFISCAIAFLRGLIREILTIIGVVGGLTAAYFLGPLLAPMTRSLFGVEEGKEMGKLFDLIPYSILADGLTFGAIFLIVVVILSVASHFLASGAKAVGLGALDRSLGVVFGLLRGVLILALLYLPFYMLVEKETRAEWFESSRTRVYVEATAGWVVDLIPESLLAKSEEQAEETAEALKSTREKLQEIDVLSKGAKEKAPAPKTAPAEDAAPAAEEPGPAYKEEERQGLQNLIEDSLKE